MAMERWVRYKSLVRVYLATLFTNLSGGLNPKKKKSVGVSGKEVSKKIVSGILVAIGIVVLLVLLVSSVVSATVLAVEQGFVKELSYVLVGVCQLTVLILGGNVVLSYLYFSNDMDLLLSLPITPGEAFAAKFSVSYISQLVISAFFVPVLLSFGITASLNGVEISPLFYVLAVFSVVLLPAFPLVLIGVFSSPIMFILRFFKNKDLIKTVFTVISSLLGMALYLAIAFSTNIFGEGDGSEVANILPIVQSASKYMVFNYNFCEALLGDNALLNALFYVLECVGSIGFAILLCGFFYKRIMYNMLDNGSGRKKKIKGEVGYKSVSYRKNLFIKDLKIIFKSPVLLFSTALGLIMCPVFTVLFHNVFDYADESSSVYAAELSSLGMIYYFNTIMLISSNMATSVFISLEKGNIAVLKSLPVSGKDVVFSKIKVSAILLASNCLTFLIAYFCLTRFLFQPLIGIALAVIIFMQGLGFSIWELMRDMEAPNFRFNNVNELTKNNKRMIKPMFLSMGTGIGGMIVAIVLGSVLPEKFIYLGYVAFFLLTATVACLYFFIPLNKMMKNVETLYERLEA